MAAHKHPRSFYVWSHLSKYTHGNYHQHIIVWLSFKILVPSDSLSFTFQSIVLLSYPPHRVYQPPPPPVSGLSGGLSCCCTEQTSLCSSSQLSLNPHTNPKLCDNLVYLVIIFSIIFLSNPYSLASSDWNNRWERRHRPSEPAESCCELWGKEPCRNKHLEDKNCRGFIFFKEVASRWWLLHSCECGTLASL